jgi:hypothetical protein
VNKTHRNWFAIAGFYVALIMLLSIVPNLIPMGITINRGQLSFRFYEAQAAGSQSFFPTPVTNITPSALSAWTAVNVASYVPAGTTGVVLHVISGPTTTALSLGWRKSGSTDARTYPIEGGNGHTYAAIGVNATYYLDLYRSDAGSRFYMTAYTTSGVTFLTNGVNITLTTLGAWTDIDVSGTAPSGTVGVILELGNETLPQSLGVRNNGSTDDRASSIGIDRHAGAIVGCDSNRIFEAYMDDPGSRIFLVGYITSGATFYINALDYSLDSAGAWKALKQLPERASFGFFEDTWGLRSAGSVDTITGQSVCDTHDWATIEATDGQIEGTISTTLVKFYLMGYAEGPSGWASRSPTTINGTSWVDAVQAYNSSTGYANITSGLPSSNASWGGYGFTNTSNVTSVRVRSDAYSVGSPTVTYKNATGDAVTLGAYTLAQQRTVGALFGQNVTWSPTGGDTLVTAMDEFDVRGTSGDATNITSPVTTTGGILWTPTSNFTIPSGATVTNVMVYIRSCDSTTSGTNSIGESIRVGSTNYTGTVRNPAVAGTITAYSSTWANNPAKGAVAWTPAEVNGTNATFALRSFGLTSNDLNPGVRVYLIVIECNYTYASNVFASINKTTEDDGTYLKGTTDTANHYHFSFANFTVPATSTVVNLTVVYRARDGLNAAVGVNTIRGSIKVDGVVYNTTSTTSDPGSLFTTYSYNFSINPDTGIAWTPDDINGIGGQELNAFGIASTDGAPDFDVSMVYAQVYYTSGFSNLRLYVTWDNMVTWSSAYNFTTSGAKTSYWTNVTAATSWTTTKLNNTNFKVKVEAYSNGTTTETRLDWLPVEIYYSDAGGGGGSPSIANTPSWESFGSVNQSSTYYAIGHAPSNPVSDSDCTFTLSNDGSITVNVNFRGENWTGGTGWNLTSSSPGVSTVRMTLMLSGYDPAVGYVVTTTDAEFWTLTPGQTFKWDIKLETGTFLDGVLKSTNIIFTAVAA